MRESDNANLILLTSFFQLKSPNYCHSPSFVPFHNSLDFVARPKLCLVSPPTPSHDMLMSQRLLLQDHYICHHQYYAIWCVTCSTIYFTLAVVWDCTGVCAMWLCCFPSFAQTCLCIYI